MHPRPQLTRQRWTDLCGRWEFAFDDGDRGLDGGWADSATPFDRTITVPFPPESVASGVGDAGSHPVVWYRRGFTVGETERDDRMLLHFGAVDYRAHVWLNGRLVATHEGGHTPFTADITAALRPGEAEQVLVVRAADDPSDVAQPRGKQYWRDEPESIWYHRTTGIWQPVWLEPVPARHIAAARWSTRPSEALVELDAEVDGATTGTAMRVRLLLGDQLLAEHTQRLHGSRTRLRIELPAARNAQDATRLLWAPEHPILVDAELALLVDGEPVDTARSYLGLREVGVGDGRFLLNGRPYFLRMVLEQGFWPDSHLAAPDGDALRREVELIKSLGFNGVRIHQKVEDPRFLYHCDRLGLLVWDEMPSAYEFSPVAAQRLVREWSAVVRRDAGHPCVAAWVPFNESWGVDRLATDAAQRHLVEALYHLTRALDPGRPVIANDGWEHVTGDIIGVHDYAQRAAVLGARYGDRDALAATLAQGRPAGRRVLLDGADSGVPVMVTEYGGLSYHPEPDGSWHGYGTAGDAGELLQRYTELTTALLASPYLAGFCYTQLTDTMQETNGLLTAGRVPKIDPAAVYEATAAPNAAGL